MVLSDPQGAKSLLMPRVANGKATRQEIELLRMLCKELRDSVCVAMTTERLESR